MVAYTRPKEIRGKTSAWHRLGILIGYVNGFRLAGCACVLFALTGRNFLRLGKSWNLQREYIASGICVNLSRSSLGICVNLLRLS